MNPFASRMSGNAWIIPVSALCLVLGFMAVTAGITATTRSSRLSLLGASQGIRVGMGPIDLQEEYAKISDEVAKLRAENEKLQNSLGRRDSTSKVLNDSLQEAKAFAGLTELEGPGVSVTLADSKKPPPPMPLANNYIIHDMDVLKVVNEMFAAGAEAIDVNGHRVVTTSSFRCVGPVIHVDGVPVASPVVIRAIGDPAALQGGLELPDGVLAEIRQTDPDMAQIQQIKDMRLGAYTGSTARKFSKAPPPTETKR